jgi:hypothetical protein
MTVVITGGFPLVLARKWRGELRASGLPLRAPPC